MLELHSLEKKFSAAANFKFTDLSLAIAANQITVVLGESGSGKSTLARLILLLPPPDSGRIIFENKTVFAAGAGQFRLTRRELANYRRRVQLIWQNSAASLNPRHTGVQTLLEAPLYHQLYRNKALAREEILQLSQRCGLTFRHVTSYPHQLSGGQQQRLTIARALALQPQLLIADEPFAALDLPIQVQLVTLLRELKESYQLSILWMTHNIYLARHFSDRVAILYRGRLIEYGDSRTIFAAPRHPASRELLAPMLPPDSSGQQSHPLQRGRAGGCPFLARCRHSRPDCALMVPPLVNISQGHQVACLHPREDRQ